MTNLLAGIVGRDPDLGALPPATPASIRRLLRRCLEKDRRRRLSDISDARLDIEEALAAPSSDVSSPAEPVLRPSRARWLMAAALPVVGAVIGIAGSLWLRPAATAPVPARFVIVPPATEPLYTEATGTPIAISPDGQCTWSTSECGEPGSCSFGGSISSRPCRCPAPKARDNPSFPLTASRWGSGRQPTPRSGGWPLAGGRLRASARRRAASFTGHHGDRTIRSCLRHRTCTA